MCGIVGATTERNAVPLLLEALKRLEYRGYDSAGIAVLDAVGDLDRCRAVGKVCVLEQRLERVPLYGCTGIAHTRWATHGIPSERNAHPHFSRAVAVVHNGIIENYAELKQHLQEDGYTFDSDTDTEVVAHLVDYYLDITRDLLAAVRRTVAELRGAYALGVISACEPGRLIGARRGSPLVAGLGYGENFIASDIHALLPFAQRFIYFEDGDLVDVRRDSVQCYNAAGELVERPIVSPDANTALADKGTFRHFMLKEIYDQPTVIAETLEGRVSDTAVLEEAFGPTAKAIFDRVHAVKILACGTSYHAGLVAGYWLEALAGIACTVEVASEFRYRQPVLTPDTLVVAISQSGETADTLAAVLEAKRRAGAPILAICNVASSSLVRAADLFLMTRAGPEIGVASTKAFTTQLVALMLLVLCLGRRHALLPARERDIVERLWALPARVEQVLSLEPEIKHLAEELVDKQHALFLGRGLEYPVAKEGALKLKEISYIHAEAYPAGELKHGPLALIDEEMPVIAVAPNNELLEKLKSNLQEVRARGGKLYVFADEKARLLADEGTRVLVLAEGDDLLSPVIYSVPLQLLAYHVAVLRGTDVDQPRNLAKSVTVE